MPLRWVDKAPRHPCALPAREQDWPVRNLAAPWPSVQCRRPRRGVGWTGRPIVAISFERHRTRSQDVTWPQVSPCVALGLHLQPPSSLALGTPTLDPSGEAPSWRGMAPRSLQAGDPSRKVEQTPLPVSLVTTNPRALFSSAPRPRSKARLASFCPLSLLRSPPGGPSARPSVNQLHRRQHWTR